MYPPPLPDNPEYELEMPDDVWLDLNKRGRKDPQILEEIQVKLERGLVKQKRVERRKKRAEAKALAEEKAEIDEDDISFSD